MNKRFSREDILLGKVPSTAEFLYHEKDSDYSWYKVWTEEQYKRVAEYLKIPWE
tara:strand:+ start:2363 stop:2524 length:162 start_codon:yes stop_codon:yes gene_type:complete